MNSLSWERSSNCYSNVSTNRNRSSKSDLLAFGYSCKLFNDDVSANFLEQGKNLVPFLGDNNLLIDRSVGF